MHPVSGQSTKAKWHLFLAPTLVVAVLSGLAISSSDALAKRFDYSLVPPPPATAPLMVPPAPVALPYSYALSAPSAEEASQVFAVVKPQPQPAPRPIGLLPANAPNLSQTFARSRGFGTPRSGYASNEMTSTTDSFPAVQGPASNSWFDASLRWYANRVNAQNYYRQLNQQSPSNYSGAQQVAYAPAQYTAPAIHRRSSSKSHQKPRRRHFKRIIATR